MPSWSAVALLSVPAFATAAVPQFNNSKCPNYWEMQAPHVVSSFDLSVMDGYFYELAFHDYTQFPSCPAQPRCITSSKQVQKHSDGVRFVNDTWDLNCFGAFYPQDLLFNITDKPGYFEGYVPEILNLPLPKDLIANMKFPDTVVDFKSGKDGWVLEIQCLEHLNHVIFIGINYYSKSTSEEAFQEIDAAARARGLGYWMDHGFGLKRVNHTGCANEPPPHVKRSFSVGGEVIV